jgi:hypothetical protein
MTKDFDRDDKKMIPLVAAASSILSPLHATVGKSIPR